MHLWRESSSFCPAGQPLPCLETLFLHDKGQLDAGIDVLGFPRLKHLVVEGRYVRQILHNPSCHVGLHVDPADDLRRRDNTKASVALRKTAEATRDLALSVPCGLCERTQSPPMFEHFASLETLRVNWPVDRRAYTGQSVAGAPNFGAKDILRRCMPLNGRPLESLKSLIIFAEGAMKCLVPKALPNLEELVLFSTGRAKVYFDDAYLTLARVNTFYVLGQPLVLKLSGSATHELQLRLATRGLSMSSAVANEEGKDSRCGRTCVYLRPVAAPEQTFREVYDRVDGLARECRCKACFDCLRRAGCLTWS